MNNQKQKTKNMPLAGISKEKVSNSPFFFFVCTRPLLTLINLIGIRCMRGSHNKRVENMKVLTKEVKTL